MTTGDLGSLLRELIEKWRDARAHTYASENADLYRGFENGQRRCADDLERLLAARPAAPRTEPLTYYVDGSGFACESKTGRRLRGDDVVAALNQRAAPAPATGDPYAQLKAEVCANVGNKGATWTPEQVCHLAAAHRQDSEIMDAKDDHRDATGDLVARLREAAEHSRNQWITDLLREAADTLEKG